MRRMILCVLLILLAPGNDGCGRSARPRAPVGHLEWTFQVQGDPDAVAQALRRRVEILASRGLLPSGRTTTRLRPGSRVTVRHALVGGRCDSRSVQALASRVGSTITGSSELTFMQEATLSAEAVRQVADLIARLPFVTRATPMEDDYHPERTPAAIEVELRGTPPAGWLEPIVVPKGVKAREEVASPLQSRPGAPPKITVWLANAAPLLGGDIIASAEVAADAQLRPDVAVEFTPAGREALAEITTRLVRQRILIVVDGRVRSAPLVQDPITGGRARITLGSLASKEQLFSEARELATRLVAGSLPGRVTLEQASGTCR